MKRKKLAILIILLSTFYFLLSTSLFAAGLVPCGQGSPTILQDGKAAPNPAFRACTFCDFFVLIQNIINLLLGIFVSLATLMAAYIAFLFMFSGGSPQKITDAKNKLWLLVIGIFWVLGSWLVLNTILNFIVDKSVFPWPWNKIDCSVSQPSSSSSASESGGSGILPGAGLSEQEARNDLQQSGITVNKGACPSGVSYQNVSGGCTSLEGLRASSIEGAKQLKEDCNCTVIVTGGTEKGHSTVGTKTHENGYKLDFARNNTLDSYITNNYTYSGIRSDDGAKLYKSPSGAIFAKESDHWDTKGWDAEF